MKKLISILFCTAALAVAAQDFDAAGEAFTNGVILKREKKYNDAVSEFERAVVLAGNTNDPKMKGIAAQAKQQIVNCHIVSANTLFDDGAIETAIMRLETAKAAANLYSDKTNLKLIDEAMPRMIFAQGIGAMQAGSCEGAILFFERSLALNPNQSSVLLSEGTCLIKMGDAQKALEFYEKTIKAATLQNNPKDAAEARKAAVSYLLSAGQDAKEQHYYDGAYKYFSMLTKFDPNNGDGYLQMAVAANFNKKYSDAIAAASKGIIVEKRLMESSWIAYQLAYAYEQNTTPDRAKACEFYQRAAMTNDDAVRQHARDAQKRLRCGR